MFSTENHVCLQHYNEKQQITVNNCASNARR